MIFQKHMTIDLKIYSIQSNVNKIKKNGTGNIQGGGCVWGIWIDDHMDPTRRHELCMRCAMVCVNLQSRKKKKKTYRGFYTIFNVYISPKKNIYIARDFGCVAEPNL